MKEKGNKVGAEKRQDNDQGLPNQLTSGLEDSIGLSSEKLRGSEERELTLS